MNLVQRKKRSQVEEDPQKPITEFKKTNPRPLSGDSDREGQRGRACCSSLGCSNTKVYGPASQSIFLTPSLSPPKQILECFLRNPASAWIPPKTGRSLPPRQLSSLRHHKAAASFVTIASSVFLLPAAHLSLFRLLGKNFTLRLDGAPLPQRLAENKCNQNGRSHPLLASGGEGPAGLFSTVGQRRPLVVITEITAHRWRRQPSTYFVHDPVGIFNGSFNNLLDSLRIVFI